MVQLVFLLMLNLMIPQHKFYLSVTEIRYAEKEESLQIAIKLFTDDMQLALSNQNKQQIMINSNKLSPQQLALIKQYLTAHFEVKVNGKVAAGIYLGSEIQMDATWSYIEIKNIRKIHSIEIKNLLLINEFEEQVNILNFIYKDETHSFIGNSENFVFKLKF